MLSDSETSQAGIEVAHRIMAQLDVEAAQLIEGAYVDLLAEEKA